MAQQPTDQETLKSNETYSLISADKVQGTDVYNSAGQSIGDIDDVMIDKVSGKVAYAVVSFGGFLGMGKERRALPWSTLTYSTDVGGYVTRASDDVLRTTPDTDDYANQEWGTRLHQHYGVSPYWLP
jgi:sporulation protein YlmC with PRC-barrel domain